jgi:hypothetical protein
VEIGIGLHEYWKMGFTAFISPQTLGSDIKRELRRTPNIGDSIIEHRVASAEKGRLTWAFVRRGHGSSQCRKCGAEMSTRNAGEEPGMLAPAVIPALGKLKWDQRSSGVQDHPGNTVRPCIKKRERERGRERETGRERNTVQLTWQVDSGQTLLETFRRNSWAGGISLGGDIMQMSVTCRGYMVDGLHILT